MPAYLDDVRRLIRAEQGLAVVSIGRPDGSVHASVVNAGVLDEVPAGASAGGPAIAFVAQGVAKKLSLLRRAGQATVTFRVGWQWAAVEGPARLIGPDEGDASLEPAALAALLREIFRAAGGTHDDWDAYDRAMLDERRAAVLVTPRRILGNG